MYKKHSGEKLEAAERTHFSVVNSNGSFPWSATGQWSPLQCGNFIIWVMGVIIQGLFTLHSKKVKWPIKIFLMSEINNIYKKLQIWKADKMTLWSSAHDAICWRRLHFLMFPRACKHLKSTMCLWAIIIRKDHSLTDDFLLAISQNI